MVFWLVRGMLVGVSVIERRSQCTVCSDLRDSGHKLRLYCGYVLYCTVSWMCLLSLQRPSRHPHGQPGVASAEDVMSLGL